MSDPEECNVPCYKATTVARLKAQMPEDEEMQRLAELFDGRRVRAGSSCFVTSNGAVLAQARRLGYAGTLEQAGVTILEGVCFYILQNLSPMRIANGWSNMVSNSAKIVNIIGAHRFNTILRRTAECVDIACSGALR
jgi:hypothetical protein